MGEINLVQNKLLFINFAEGTRTCIMEDAKAHTEKIKEFYYLVELLRINFPALKYYLRNNYEEKDYPLSLKNMDMVANYEWHWGFGAEFKNTGHFLILEGENKSKSPWLFKLGFPTTENIPNFIHPDDFITDIDKLYFENINGEYDGIRIYSSEDTRIFGVFRKKDKESAIMDLLDILKNMEICNSCIESSEDAKKGYLSYLRKFVLRESDPKSARSSKT